MAIDTIIFADTNTQISRLVLERIKDCIRVHDGTSYNMNDNRFIENMKCNILNEIYIFNELLSNTFLVLA